MTAILTVLNSMGAQALPANENYENRFQIKSASSDRRYVVAQSRNSHEWSCSCPAHIYQKGAKKPCKHLRALGLAA